MSRNKSLSVTNAPFLFLFLLPPKARKCPRPIQSHCLPHNYLQELFPRNFYNQEDDLPPTWQVFGLMDSWTVLLVLPNFSIRLSFLIESHNVNGKRSVS